jgi:hypothetical protein
MTIDERELSQRLAETAAQISAPVFTTEELSGRIGRRRTRFFATAAGTVAAVAAVAVAVPVALRGPAAGPGASTTTGPVGVSQPVVGRPASAGPPPLFVVTVNGRARASAAGFVVSPGERLTIILDVTVPARQSLSALWVGITNGMLAPRPDGPADMSPILAADRSPLGPGVHQFTLHWVTPGGMRAGATRQLSAEWLWFHPAEPGAGGEKEIAGLTVSAAAGT